MKMPGYRSGCRRIRPVLVSGHALAMARARGGHRDGTLRVLRTSPAKGEAS